MPAKITCVEVLRMQQKSHTAALQAVERAIAKDEGDGDGQTVAEADENRTEMHKEMHKEMHNGVSTQNKCTPRGNSTKLLQILNAQPDVERLEQSIKRLTITDQRFGEFHVVPELVADGTRQITIRDFLSIAGCLGTFPGAKVVEFKLKIQTDE